MEDWGPWIEHDGARGPAAAPGTRITLKYADGDLIAPPLTGITRDWPGFFWRWRWGWLGGLSFGWRRVCTDPAYAPIIAYRLRFPPRKTGVVAMEILRRVAADPSRSVAAPEGPLRAPERVA